MLYQKNVIQKIMTWQNHRDLKVHPKKILRREDQLGLMRSFRMQRSMVIQIELSEKARSQNHIPVTSHGLVQLLMQSLPVMKRLQIRKNGRIP